MKGLTHRWQQREAFLPLLSRGSHGRILSCAFPVTWQRGRGGKLRIKDAIPLAMYMD